VYWMCKTQDIVGTAKLVNVITDNVIIHLIMGSNDSL